MRLIHQHGILRFVLAAVFLLTACTPEVQNKNFTSPKTDFGPPDDLAFSQITPQTSKKFSIRWKGKIKSEEFLEALVLIFQISTEKRDRSLVMNSSLLFEKLNRQESSSVASRFSQTPYLQMMISQAAPQVREAIAQIDLRLKEDLNTLKKFILDENSNFPWNPNSSFSIGVENLEKFLNQIIEKIPSLHLQALFEKPLLRELRIQKEKNIEQLRKFAQRSESPLILTALLKTITDLVQTYNYEMDAESKEFFKLGQSLAQSIDSFQNENEALTVILKIWKILTPQEREQRIKPVSKELYDHLKNKSDREIDCLINNSCFAPFQSFVRVFFILPKLRAYGLEKLRTNLNEGTHNFARKTLDKQISAYLPKVAVHITQAIEEKLKEERRQIDVISADVEKFLSQLMVDWGKKNFDTSSEDMMSYEKPFLQIEVNSNGVVDLKAVDGGKDQGSSASLGAGLALQAQLWQQKAFSEKRYRRSVLEQVSKILGFGGVEIKPRVVTEGLMRPVTGNQRFNLIQALQRPTPFAIQDTFELKTPYTLTSNSLSKPLQISAKSQSLLLEGLMTTAEHFRDWEVNEFDQWLGHIDASEFFQSENRTVNQRLFPKEKFFVLALAHIGNILKNFKKTQTPVILFSESGDRVWADQIDQARGPITMAAVVDTVNGQKSTLVQSANLSRWILTLRRYLNFVEGLEKSKAPELRERDSDGKTALDQINESKADLKNLILALGNFLSSQMLDFNSVVYPAIDYTVVKSQGPERNVEDQFLAIDALLTVFETTGMKVYLWTAYDIYRSLRTQFNEETGFFGASGQGPSIIETARAVRSFHHLSEYMNPEDQKSIQKASEMWMSGLRRLH